MDILQQVVLHEEQLVHAFLANKTLYESMQRDLMDIVPALLDSQRIAVALISYRIKTEDSLRKKIHFKSKYEHIHDITDLIGCRIVALFESDVERIFRLLLSQFKVVEVTDKRKKRVAGDVDFGYSSLHAILAFQPDETGREPYAGVCFEVQIRTVLQHAWADVEHGLGYKTDFETPLRVRRRLSRIAACLELLDEEFENIRREVEAYEHSLDRIEKVLRTDINKNSLIQYILGSERAIAFNARLAETLSLPVRPDAQILSRMKLVERLHFLGYQFIQEIDELLQKEQEVLFTIACLWMRATRADHVNPYALALFMLAAATKEATLDEHQEGMTFPELIQAVRYAARTMTADDVEKIRAALEALGHGL